MPPQLLPDSERMNVATTTGFRPCFIPMDFGPRPASVSAKPKVRRKLRTVSVLFNANGKLQGAQIDMTTGEVSPYAYKDYSDGQPKARPDPTAPDTVPFWMEPMHAPTVSADTTGYEDETEDKSRKKLANGAKFYLQWYVCLKDAIEDFPALDHVMTGATSLDLGGNTRGLNRQHLFTMLQNLDTISPTTVRAFANHSKSHSEKVAVCLRIIVHGFMSALKTGTPNPNLT